MALHQVPIDDLPSPFREKVQRVEALGGDVEFFRVAANTPEILDLYWRHFYADVFHAGVAPVRVKELVRLRLAALHGCGFCRVGDIACALDHGVTREEADAVLRLDDTPFSGGELAALEVATVLSNALPMGRVDARQQTALEQHFTDSQVVELLFVIAILTGVGKMLAGMGYTDEECPVPEVPGALGAAP